LAIGCVIAGITSTAAGQGLTGNLAAHDPSSVIRVDGTYYFFHTGTGVQSKSSTNRINWSAGPAVFATAPSWIAAAVPDNMNRNYWAPDVAYFNDLYHLYYSVSTFGSQDSAIGLATSPTLDPSDPDYLWTDRGPVIQSNPGQNPYNTIDPAIFQTSTGDVWMTFGSFWNGIYITQLDPATGLRVTPNSPTISLARHLPLTPNAIEAPYIHERDGLYYLFVNWDTCCQGTNSTYNIRVGRSANITGPYLDQNGVNMVNGGGTLFLGSEGDFIGPGHISIFDVEGGQWFGYHYYDGNANGAATYNLRSLLWTVDGWPVAGPSTLFASPDLNLDGEVDLVDFGILGDHMRQTGASHADGDMNGDAVVDYRDFQIWKSIYHSIHGVGAGAVINVPEPSSLLLLLSAAAAAGARRGTRMGPPSTTSHVRS
jgi:arabinan endo-1,5-alpha-L-arabinosidase